MNNAMKKYRWARPYEWVEEKSKHWGREKLLTEFLNLARITDSDTIQDMFQSEMDADGYFNEEIEREQRRAKRGRTI